MIKRVHKQKPFQAIDEIFDTIRDCMDEDVPDAVIHKLRDRDVILGKKSPSVFSKCTEQLFSDHYDQRGLHNDRETLKHMYLILIEEGFRILDADQSNEGWTQVSFNDGIDIETIGNGRQSNQPYLWFLHLALSEEERLQSHAIFL